MTHIDTVFSSFQDQDTLPRTTLCIKLNDGDTHRHYYDFLYTVLPMHLLYTVLSMAPPLSRDLVNEMGALVFLSGRTSTSYIERRLP